MNRILSLILCLSMVFSFAACKRSGDVIVDTGTSNKAEQSETVKTEVIDQIAEPSKNQAGFYDYKALCEIAGKTDARYILIEREGSSDSFSLIATDRNAFKDVYNNTALADYLKSSGFEKEDDVLGMIEANAILLAESIGDIEGLITNKPKDGENTYIAYNNSGMGLTAFGDVFKEGILPTDYIKSEGLNIKVANAKLIKLIGSQSMADDLYAVSAVVDADVMCFDNEGVFKNVSWIPAKGSMNSVRFIITFMSFKSNGGHNALISDIGATAR